MSEKLNPPMTDQDFEDYLEGRSRLTRGYDRLRAVEPPPWLDRAVLGEARAAAAADRRRLFSRTHWSSRLAAAAAVALALAVVLQLRPGPDVDESQLADEPVASSAARDDRARGPGAPGQSVGDVQPAASPVRRAASGQGAHEGPAAAALEPPPSGRATGLAAPPAGAEQDSAEDRRAALLALAAARPAGDPARSAALMRVRVLGASRAPTQGSRTESGELSGRAGTPAAAAPEPAAWLALVDALLEAGEEDVARSELGALAEAWPAHPLDPRYEAWLPGHAVGGPSR